VETAVADEVEIKVLGQEMVHSPIFHHGNAQDGDMGPAAAGPSIGRMPKLLLINPSLFLTNSHRTSIFVPNVVHLYLLMRTIVQAAV
jgi:hypothetical protein